MLTVLHLDTVAAYNKAMSYECNDDAVTFTTKIKLRRKGNLIEISIDGGKGKYVRNFCPGLLYISLCCVLSFLCTY